MLLVVLAALPLVWPSIPPLVDLPGHMAQYKIELDLDRSPFLRRYYDYQWGAFGNLGVDLLMAPLGRLLGVELAAKLIVLAIPPLTVAGMLWVAREIHGRIPATAFFALPLAYAYPFQFGFVNFALAVATMFPAIGLWLWLGRLNRLRLRALVFIPISLSLFLAHAVAWGMFGLILFTIECVSLRDKGERWRTALTRAILNCLPLAPPLLLTARWISGVSAAQAYSVSWAWKIYYAVTVLRNSSRAFDVSSALLLYILVILALRRRGLGMDGRLKAAALVLFGVFLLMPFVLMGAAYADMRLAPYPLAIAVLGISPTTENRKWQQILALGGLAFCGVRFGTQGWTYWKLADRYDAQLAALDRLPTGARVFSMSSVPCEEWDQPRMDTLQGIATVRRDAFVNGQWPMPGGRLVSVRYAPAQGYALAPTQLLQPADCRQPESYSLDFVVAHLPRSAFDYLWLVNVPEREWPRDRALVPVWRSADGVLLRIRR